MYVPRETMRAPTWVFQYSTTKEATLKPLCERVEAEMQLPATRVCRYFADSDDPYFLQRYGDHFRGFHIPRSTRTVLPQYLAECFFHPFDCLEHENFKDTIAFDHLIYIRNSTCDDHTGLVTTYAHEWQHVIQHETAPRLLTVNQILYQNLRRIEPTAVAIDIPIEREANVVSKRVAEAVCGADVVHNFAEEQVRRMHDMGEHEQESKWIFFRDVPASTDFSLLNATLPFIEKYKGRIDFEIDVNQPEWWVEPLNKDRRKTSK